MADERGVMDEGVARALEAYYLTARAHGVAVIFNLFAFTPEVFGGADPYFDPQALAGQRAFVGTLARRMAPARELVWDLINEPSFASPEKLWSLRPSGSDHERRAFLAWLEARHGAGWEDAVRRRWRLRADEPVDLPKEGDFQDAYLPGERRPYRALDYALFAQDAFERWIGDMTRAIRDAGSDGPITVGQDEAGLTTSPSPLFHHRSLDFTSIHTWWSNDALLWDGLMAKPSGAPLLVSETGIIRGPALAQDRLRVRGRRVRRDRVDLRREPVHRLRQRGGDRAQTRRRELQARARRARRRRAVRPAQPRAVRRPRGARRRATRADRRSAVAAQHGAGGDARGDSRAVRDARPPRARGARSSGRT